MEILPYVYLYSIIAFSAVLARIGVASIKNISAYLVAFILVVFSGIRIDNKDYVNYLKYYDDSPTLGAIFQYISTEKIDVEYGFLFFNSFLKTFNVGNDLYFLVVAFISIFVTLIGYKKIFKDYFLIFLIAVSFVFISFYFTQIRQGLALSFSILAVAYLLNGSKLFYFLFSIIAISFHTSALVILLFYFIYTLKYNNYYLLLIPLGVVLNLTNIDVVFFEIIINFFANDQRIAYKIGAHYFMGRDVYVNKIYSGTSLLVIMVSLYMGLRYSYLSKQYPYVDVSIISLLISFCVFHFFSNSGEVGARFFREVAIFLPVAVFMMLRDFKFNRIFGIVIFIFFIFVSFMYYGHAGGNWDEYKTILD